MVPSSSKELNKCWAKSRLRSVLMIMHQRKTPAKGKLVTLWKKVTRRMVGMSGRRCIKGRASRR